MKCTLLRLAQTATAPSLKERPRVGHDEVRVELGARPEPAAGRAGALRRIEGKAGRREVAVADAAGGADGRVPEGQRFAAGDIDHDGAVALGQRELDRIRQTVADRLLDDQPVHHHLDRVRLAGRECGHLVDLLQGAVHPHPGKACLFQPLEELLVGCLSLR